ncbi:uncharacterized protein LOC110027987 [Phalaenopsis equestris]|uniref:uncharacterized protein LOC110027987 n=1 Tax=Phalaenopsis equestris TaxID=78828 RepID=UPI0009E26A9B|nr:uncharacterized protein LOC110027987 [Phalaenopsis equestris]
MEEISGNGDAHGNLLKPNSIHASGSFKSSLSGRSGARNSPAFRRLQSSRTPRRDLRSGSWSLQWIRSNRVVFWLLLITMWAYIGFHVQSRWAHSDHRQKEFVGYKDGAFGVKNQEDASKDSKSNGSNPPNFAVKEPKGGKNIKNSDSSDSKLSVKRITSMVKSSMSKRGRRVLKKVAPKVPVMESTENESDDVLIPKRNTSFGLMVGSFGNIEDRIFEWSPEKRKGTCDRKGRFAKIVWSRTIILIFHELSMTGAPLSMMELATELLSCGGYVKAVVLSKKGGLMSEFDKRGISILEDKGEISFKAAMKADLVIAGSAVSSSWIEQYLRRNPAGSNQLVWWIMENRLEYFNRSKNMLGQVKMLTFLSDIQSNQWLSWCKEENIKLKSQPMIVPLSVNDELAFAAGIPCSLNTPAFGAEKMTEKRDFLRIEVRKEMGLSDNDMLVMTLSSVNPAKGQLLLLEAAHLVTGRNVSQRDPIIIESELSLHFIQNQTAVAEHLETNQTGNAVVVKRKPTSKASKKRKRKRSRSNSLSLLDDAETAKQDQRKLRRLLSDKIGAEEQSLKILIGSIGSKSNKVSYVKRILGFLSQSSNMSKSVLWTRATTRVASLYAAADVYVINSQGVGETFGRVTVEAMAFGLPVLGTDAGGTREIVEDKVTGLLHPVGHEGTQILAQNIQFFLNNPPARKKMGLLGRQRVQEKYLKHHTYSRLAEVFIKCMKVK